MKMKIVAVAMLGAAALLAGCATGPTGPTPEQIHAAQVKAEQLKADQVRVKANWHKLHKGMTIDQVAHALDASSDAELQMLGTMKVVGAIFKDAESETRSMAVTGLYKLSFKNGKLQNYELLF